MFGKLGDLAPLIKALMSGDKAAMLEVVRPHLPDILRMVVTGTVLAADGDPNTDAAFVWLHPRPDGTITVMATVYRRSALDEPAEAIGTVDLMERLQSMDISDLIQ